MIRFAHRFALAAALALWVAPVGLYAAEGPPAPKDEKPIPDPYKKVTQHKLKVDGGDLAYTAIAEEIYLRDAADKPTATFFTVSYTKDGVKDARERPITFVYNGGPGSSSIWLHFGLVGPKIIDIPSDAKQPAGPPFTLRDNPWSILKATDLVMVDPVGTGFSKALGEKKNEDYWGFDEDAASVADMIRVYLTAHGRWNSPKYLLGESYGGIRSALLVPALLEHDIALNGVMLISPALNMATLPFVVAGNDLPFATTLPAMTATAYYHGKLPDKWPNLEAALDASEKFAGTTYLQALFQGDTLSAAEKAKVAAELRRFTGLSEDYLRRSDLRPYARRYLKELLRDEGKSVGLLDGRYVQDELDDVAAFPDGDPFSAKTSPAYVALYQDYLKKELEVDWTRKFYGLNLEANQSWKRPQGEGGAFNGFVDVTGRLAQGTKDNDFLRVFSAGGYHDLTTSYFATEYMLQHSGIDPARLVIKNYEGGHMMYLYQPALEQLSADLVTFIRGK